MSRAAILAGSVFLCAAVADTRAQDRQGWGRGPDSWPAEASVVVERLPAGGYVARDPRTAAVVARDAADAGKVVNAAVAAVAASTSGGLIFFRGGSYSVTTRIDLVGVDHVGLAGAGDAELTGGGGALILIDGASSHITIRDLAFRSSAGAGVNVLYGKQVRILDCVFEDLGDSAIKARVGDDPTKPVEGLWIERCVVRRSAGARAIHIYRTYGLFLRDNLVEDCAATGIGVFRESNPVLVAGNICRNNGVTVAEHGIFVGGGSRQVVIRDNVCTGNGGNGIEAASGPFPSPSTRAPEYLITGNMCLGNGVGGSGATRVGIFITGRDHVVSHNVVRGNSGAGIQVGYADHAHRILITDNVVANNNTAGNQVLLYGAGIALTASSNGSVRDQEIVIRGNIITQDSSSGGQLAGIYIPDQSDGVRVEQNHLSGMPQPVIQWGKNASRVEVRDNTGFGTEARGELRASFASSNSGTLALDLSGELNVDEVLVDLAADSLQLTATSGPSAGSFHYWFSHAGGAVFDVHWVSSAPLSSVSFVWRYAD